MNDNISRRYFISGTVKFKQKNYIGAIKDFDKAIRLKPDYITAYNSRGLAKHEIADFSGALLDFRKAIELQPFLSVLHYNKGLTLQAMGNYLDAIVTFGNPLDWILKISTPTISVGICWTNWDIRLLH